MRNKGKDRGIQGIKFPTLVPNLPLINGRANSSNERQKWTEQSSIKFPDIGNPILDRTGGKHCFQNKVPMSKDRQGIH